MKKGMYSKMAVSLLCAGLFVISPAMAGSEHTAKVPDPGEALKMVVKGNNDFQAAHKDTYFESFQKGQTPKITVVSCADSRVHSDLFGIDPTNNIFMIRDIGNQIATAEGSVDYGVRHLPTSILLIMGHSGCGAIKAAMGDYSSETIGIKQELDTLGESLKADDKKGEFNERWTKNIERNVDYQVAYAKRQYSDKVKDGGLVVVGAVYDFNDIYGQGKGALVITNVDGNTDPAKIQAHPVMKELAAAQTIAHLGNLAPEADFSRMTAFGYHAPEKK